jgi:site-specific recombinase XerD
MRFDRFKPDLYSLRHFFATERLAAGAPPYLIAKTLGHSLNELTTTYEHILMENEGVIRDVWRSSTPKELLEMGVLVADKRNLAF